MNKCDILLLQEHWQLENQLDNFSSIFTGTHSHGVSGMNEHEIVQGRPYGGVKCNSNRLCAILVEQVDLSMLIFNVYMPTDTDYDLKNNDIFNNILQNIACVSEDTNVDHIVIGGDFNSDLSRFKSPHTNSLNTFCEKEFLIPVILHDASKLDYTYRSRMTDDCSILDHFIVT